jgi:hypothetical protein
MRLRGLSSIQEVDGSTQFSSTNKNQALFGLVTRSNLASNFHIELSRSRVARQKFSSKTLAGHEHPRL